MESQTAPILSLGVCVATVVATGTTELIGLVYIATTCE